MEFRVRAQPDSWESGWTCQARLGATLKEVFMTIVLAGPLSWICGAPSQHPTGAAPLWDARLPTKVC